MNRPLASTLAASILAVSILVLAPACLPRMATAAAQEPGAAAPALPLLHIELAPAGVDKGVEGADDAGESDGGNDDIGDDGVENGGGDGADPAWIDVTTRISDVSLAAGEAFLRIPVQFAGVPAVAYEAEDLEVRDAAGPIPLEVTIDEPDAGGFLYFRRWSAGRAVDGEVTLRYRAPIGDYVPTLGAGPPFDLRAQGGGFSGAGNTFLVLPDTDRPFRIEIDWDLAALGEDAIGVSSFGEGDVESAGPVDRLVASYFMAGPLGRYPPAGDGESGDDRFTGYWIGDPRFDAEEVLAFSQAAYRAIADFFTDGEPPPFRVLMRGNPYPGGGGAALMNSFLVSYPEDQEDGEALRETIAHETVHNWISSIGGPPGSTSWFSEGMTVHYTRKLLLRSGLFTPAEFLESVNDTALGYYTNPLNQLPNEDIAAGFWRDTRIRSLPYARGSMYAATVDAAIRERSGGERSLDHLLKRFLALRDGGGTLDEEAWRRLVRDELGEAGVAQLDAMLDGELIVPPDDAFGPCFTREQTTLRRFELGFDRGSLIHEPRLVTGLVVESAAARAGLREGDEILRPIALERVQSDPERTLVLPVRRRGENLEVEYLPRGEAVEGYLWVRKPEVPDSRCGY